MLYQAAVEVGATVDLPSKSHQAIGNGVRVNSLEMRPTESRAMPSPHFEKKETDPIAVIKWKEIYENFGSGNRSL